MFFSIHKFPWAAKGLGPSLSMCVSAWALWRDSPYSHEASYGHLTFDMMVTKLSCFQRTQSLTTRSCTMTSPPHRWECTTLSAASGRQWTNTAGSLGDTGNHGCSVWSALYPSQPSILKRFSYNLINRIITMYHNSVMLGPGIVSHVP